jgi:predicted O-methyltransferase YrrM
MLSAALEDAPEVDLARIDPPVTRGSWSLWPEALQLLAALVTRLEPRHIVEFGSGLSTRVIAWAAAELEKPCCLSTIDNDPDLIRAAEQDLLHQARRCRVAFQFAPLVLRDCGGQLVPVYLLRADRLASRSPVDIVVIDGPPAVLGGREGTLYQALDFARPGTIALLDDAERSDERDVLSRWRDNLGEAVELIALPGFRGGLAAAIVRDPVRIADLWKHRVRLATAGIAAVVPTETSFILVDRSEWDETFWDSDAALRRRPVPFLECDGRYWGAPADCDTAIRELERLRSSGAEFLVFGWPAFWWFDEYPIFLHYVRGRFTCISSNHRVIAFDLRAPTVGWSE